MKNCFIAILKADDDIYTQANLYFDYQTYFDDVFSPSVETVEIIPLSIKGKTYTAKKEFFRDLAIKYSNADLGGISYGETAIITGFFEKNARRFGLTRELKENCII